MYDLTPALSCEERENIKPLIFILQPEKKPAHRIKGLKESVPFNFTVITK
jgi:hypothetical protein